MIEVGGRAILHHGDCLEVLKTIPDCSVDSVVCDPPAGIAFMGKEWDKDKGGRDAWIAWMQSIAQECLRVIKPGGHALVWALPRTSHWTGMAWENAGWEPRDKVVHLFGTGFPKSLNVSKQIDKAAGAEREIIGINPFANRGSAQSIAGVNLSASPNREQYVTAPATPDAAKWEGWGTALKPAAEDWWLMRKPLDGTIAGNVAKHGTGALNIDGCRVEVEGGWEAERGAGWMRSGVGTEGAKSWLGDRNSTTKSLAERLSPLGRWPANVIHDGSDEVVSGLPILHGAGSKRDALGWNCKEGGWGFIGKGKHGGTRFGDSGSAARFFYCAKASRRDREEGGIENHHPTVKNTDLMRYLCRLITPSNGLVLDPFMGSGSTGKGCMYEGFRFIGIDQEAEYVKIAEARIRFAANAKDSSALSSAQTSIFE
jgi:site-specific DNA-methyltransferase (adenine-specific)